jgi:glycosyltransferase involved in cell wall biosynthesis
MQKIKVNYIFRKRGEGHNSIEELFQSIIAHLPEEIEARVVELPYGGASLKAVLGNLWHVLFLKGIIHVTGDVYYIGLIPFKKNILTIHDIHFIKGSYFKRQLLKWFWITLPVVFSKQTTVISKFSEQTLLKLVPCARQKLRVIYNPVNPKLKSVSKETLSNPPVVLHIGTMKHKNLEHTIEAVYKCGYKLVIVGALNKAQQDGLKKYPIPYDNHTNVNFDGIKALYEACDLVSFVSYLEGFGMPVIEAQKVGRPVVTSNRCSLPEVGGNAALYVDPDDVEAIAAAYKKVIEDATFRNQLLDLGYKNIERFDINLITEEYCKLYTEL